MKTTVRIGALQIGIVLLTLATALIHLWLGALQISMGMLGGIMFLANAAGYVGLLAALYLQLPIPFIASRHSLVRLMLVLFTVVTILGWVAIGSRNEIGFLDKGIEVVLVVLLVLEARQK